MMLEFPGSLHCHTEYSNLYLRDSINRLDDMVKYAIELGHNVIGITEHDTVANAIKIEECCKKIKEKHPDFKIILGNEIYLCRDGLNGQNYERGKDKYYHFILLAKNSVGHQQIRELSTRAYQRSYMQGKTRRRPTYYQDLIDIIGKNPGNVVGSTACLGGFLGTKILEWVNRGRPDEMYSQILGWVKKMQSVFGKGNFYLEMQPAANTEQTLVNNELLIISEITGVPYIITTDAHYLKKTDAPIHKAFLNSQDGEREIDSFYATTYLMSSAEIESYFHNFTELQLTTAYQNITKIKEECENFSLLKPLKIPSLEWRETKKKRVAQDYEVWFERMPYLKTFHNSDFNGDRHMVDLIIDKLEEDPRLQYQESYDELNDNLRITWESSEVNKAHWSAYFLNLQRILDHCWDAGTIVGPGRGSGVGFYLLYILDIIQINALWETTKTYSWRFLNPNRVSVLDIDTDIEGGRRAQVLQYLRKVYGSDRVANVATFGTESSKSAVQTAARGLGIDNDISTYISSLIPADRGKIRTLGQCYYGDDEFQPIPLFVQQMNEYPELWEVAQKIEGLVCRLGEHAGGVIFVDEDFTNSTALMRAPNGDIITQFDLHDAEKASCIKIDLLSTECEDKIHACLDLLVDAGYIDIQPTLRETYNKYLDIYSLERDDIDMWKMVWNHEIQSLFQMEQQSGIQGIALTKPESVDDLAVLNSIIRLMAQDKDCEPPLEKYARFKSNINAWYAEMSRYGLTSAEQKMLEPIVGGAYGLCESQEKFMTLVQLPECGGFDLNWADRLRKAIAKKNPAEYDKLTQEYFTRVKERGLSENLCNYVWNVLIATSRGYGFNASHTLAYSLVALQEMNLAYKYPVIFWNCACLITDSGGGKNDEEEEEPEVVDIYEPEDMEEYEYIDAPDKKTKIKKKRAKTNDYDKIASAIGKMREEGISIVPPNINTSSYTFTPNVEENCIYYGLRGIQGMGEEIIAQTIENRPYKTPKDYYLKVNPKKTSMINLIKGGAFDSMMDRKLCMAWYLWEVCDKKKNLTLQNMGGLIKYGLLPTDEKSVIARRVYEFNRYLKANCKGSATDYKVDERAINFLVELEKDELLSEGMYLNIKAWDKVYQSWMNIFRDWMAENKQEILTKLNDLIFLEEWNKYALGTLSAWEMQSLSFYYHELKDVNVLKYGFSDFNSLPEDPVVEKTFVKGGRTINIFKLTKICGTCIAKDKSKGIVTLLTPTGVVTVKFRKEYFSMFDKQISEKQLDGSKKVIEKSWFSRGNMVVIQGMRSGNAFVAKKYASSGGHQLYKITEVLDNGDIVLQVERYQGDANE